VEDRWCQEFAFRGRNPDFTRTNGIHCVKIPLSVDLHSVVAGGYEELALIAIRQNCAGPVLFQSGYVAIGHCGDDGLVADV
jgi:hypothetical protein